MNAIGSDGSHTIRVWLHAWIVAANDSFTHSPRKA